MIWIIVAVASFFLWLRFYTLHSVWFTSRVSNLAQHRLDSWTLVLSWMSLIALCFSSLFWFFHKVVDDLGPDLTYAYFRFIATLGLFVGVVHATNWLVGPRGYLRR